VPARLRPRPRGGWQPGAMLKSGKRRNSAASNALDSRLRGTDGQARFARDERTSHLSTSFMYARLAAFALGVSAAVQSAGTHTPS
jgi:hypothetical protein